MDFSTYDISALQPPQGRAKTQQVFKAKAQKIAGKWQIVPNSETLELEKFLDVRGNEIGLKMYHKNQLVEQILTSYDAFGNLLKRQIFRSDISMDEEEEGGDDELEFDDSEETYEDDMGEMEEEEIAHAESDNESGGGDSHKLRLVAEEEYVYDEFFSLIKSRSVSQSSEPFSNYDETITTTYNRAGRRVAERKETISPEKVQVVETKFNDWGMPTEMVEIENGLLVSNTVFSYGELQQELSRITTYTDQTTEELLREFDDCQNPILEIVSQRDGSAVATINKIVYY